MIQETLFDAGVRLAAAVKGRSTLAIATYHRVLPAPDPMLAEPDVKEFREQVTLLARTMNILPLGEGLTRLASGSLPLRALAITFDDGYANNYTCALPLLRSLGIPGTVFVATGYLDGGCMWNDVIIEVLRRTRLPVLDLAGFDPPHTLGRHELGTLAQRRAAKVALVDALRYVELDERTKVVAQIARQAEVELPSDLMLTSDQLRGLHREGVEIGGHTVNHPILARIPADKARWEIEEGARRLQEILGERPRFFAYPNGRPGRDFGPEHQAMVREAGFTHAVTTAAGLATRRGDPYGIPRVALAKRSPMQLRTAMMGLYARN